MSSKTHVYSSLDSDLREIRLLTLIPGGFEEPLQVRLGVQSLKSSPVYNALSYVWGDPASANTPRNVISIDGYDFPVTTNLLAALRHLRPSAAAGYPIILWVDAVCINQADLDERGQQVSMMRDIYASAKQVVIWLGEADEESNLVFDTLPMLANRKHRQGDEQDEELLEATRVCSSFLFGLRDQCPWFTRVWVIQELAMAKQDPLVICGHKSIAWSTLLKAEVFVCRKFFAKLGWVGRMQKNKNGWTALRNSSTEASDPSQEEDEDIEILGKWKIDLLDELYRAMKSQGGESLWRLLLISATSKATDPRDRIYALLGLLKPNTSGPLGSDDSIIVDYRKPTATVYTDAMAYIFAQGDGPYFLSGLVLPGISAPAPHITSLPPTTSQPPLPSWVPDFVRQVAGKTTQPSGTAFYPPAPNNASGAGANCNNGRRLEDGITLQVEGLFVDTIEEVVSFGGSLDSHLDQLVHLESLAEVARQRPCQFESSIRRHMEQFRKSEPLWRTLICNKISGYDTAPESYEAMYRSLLNRAVEGVDSKLETSLDQQNEYINQLKSNIGQKSFFTTENGFVGTCVPDTRKEDIVAILFGSPIPFILRPRSDTIHTDSGVRQIHSLIGGSYVSGIMAGEMVDELYCEDLMDSTTFFIR